MHARRRSAPGPVVLGPDEGTRLEAGPVRMTLKVTSEHSDRFTLLDYHVPPRFAAPPTLHHHTHEDWAAYVIEGELTFIFTDGDVAAAAGSTVFVPAGTDFAWRNEHDAPARYLAVHSPAGFDRFFVDVRDGVAARGGTVSPEVMAEVIPPLWTRYGIEPAAPAPASAPT